MDRLDRRQGYLRAITGLSEPQLQAANKVNDYLKVMEDARAMMDSPVKKAFDYLKDEKPELVKAYEPEVGPDALLDKTYYYGNRFGEGLLLARRLVEAARDTSRLNTNTALSRAGTCTRMAVRA